MKNLIQTTILAGTLIMGGAASLQAQLTSFDLGAGQDTATWDNLTHLYADPNYFNPGLALGYPFFPGSGAWPQPIAPSVGTGGIMKTAGAAFPGTFGIYFGGTDEGDNVYGGTLSMTPGSVVAGLQSVVVQLQMTDSAGFYFHDNEGPMLNYSTDQGASGSLFADFESLFAISNTTIENPTEPGEFADAGTFAFQWDLSDLGLAPGDFIDDFDITWDQVQHGILLQAQMDQGSEEISSNILPAAVPEPGTAGLVLLAGGLLLARRRKA